MKRFLKGVLTLALVGVVACTASHAEAMTKAELLDYLKGTHTIAGTQYTLTAEQVVEAERIVNAANVTSAQLDGIKNDIEAAKGTIASAGTTELDKLSDTVKDTAMTQLTSALAPLGLTPQPQTNAKGEKVLAIVDNTTGKTVAAPIVTPSGKLDFTGTETLSVMTVVAAVMLVLTTLVATKKGLLAVEK